MMALTLTPAPHGHGLLLRDTNTRAQILVEGPDLLAIGSALLQAAATQVTPPPSADGRYKGHR